jgi:hypothetical protein
MADINYVFDDDMVYAVHDGQFIASADSIGELEKMAVGVGDYTDPASYHDGPCNYCGTPLSPGAAVCDNCGKPPYEAPAADASPYPPDRRNYQGNTVVGPGGIKGTVLAKTRDIWGEEVAVRFENGRIAHLRVVQDGTLQGGFKESIEKVASTKTSTADTLQARLDVDFDSGRDGIIARLADLDDIGAEGRHHIGSVNDTEAAVLDGIIVTAEVERGTLREALEAIDAQAAADAEFAPYDIQAAPAQASLGRGEGNWLDSTVSAMIADAESQDFEQIVREGAVIFVSDLTDGALADTAVTREMALREIRSKTAGIDPTVAQQIERDYLAAAESARRQELGSRTAAIQKQASAAQADPHADLPDDILFS